LLNIPIGKVVNIIIVNARKIYEDLV